MASIVLLDQAFKWWAWRHAFGTRINDGGDMLVAGTIGSWYSRPVTGALLDFFDFGLLSAAAWLLLRRRRSIPVLISGSAIIAGWSSNLLDRLLTHYWTAPGSVRGVVDFIHIGQHYYNVADLFIIAATPAFILALVAVTLRRLVLRRPAARTPDRPRIGRSRRLRTATWVLATQVALSAIVGVGAVKFGGATAPLTSANVNYERTTVTRHGVLYESP